MSTETRTSLPIQYLGHIAQASGLPAVVVASLKGDTVDERMRNALTVAPYVGARPDYLLAEVGRELYANG